MIYSERARMAIRYANEEAARLGHDHIGTGHILLGLIRQGEGTAIEILKDAEVDVDELKSDLEGMMEDRGRGTILGRLQLGNRARDVLKYAEEESRNMGHRYLGTEHLLLGLMRDQEGVGGKILNKYGIALQRAREVIQTVIVEEEEPIETITFQNTGMTVASYDAGQLPVTQSYGNEVFDIDEASQFLRIQVNEMEELLMNESIPARKINGQWRFSRSALAKWLGDGDSKGYYS